MRPSIEQGVLAAAGATVVASVVLALSAWRAVEVADARPEPPPLAAVGGDAPIPVYGGLPPDAITLIADNEPFRADREPAPESYRMPGDRVMPTPVRIEAPPPSEPPDFVIIGTVTTSDGGMAVIRTSDGLPPTFLRVNDSLGGYRLVSVATDGAVLARGGETVRLAVADPAILRDQPADPRSRNARQRAEREAQAAARENLQRQTLRLQDMVVGGQAGQSAQILIQGLPADFQAAAAAAIEQLPDEIRSRIQQGAIPGFGGAQRGRPSGGGNPR